MKKRGLYDFTVQDGEQHSIGENFTLWGEDRASWTDLDGSARSVLSHANSSLESLDSLLGAVVPQPQPGRGPHVASLQSLLDSVFDPAISRPHAFYGSPFDASVWVQSLLSQDLSGAWTGSSESSSGRAIFDHGPNLDAGADFSGGPDAAAAAGKGGGGGGGKGGGRTTDTSGGGSTGGTTDTGTTTTTVLSNKSPAVTVMWQPLNPPTEDSTLPSDTYFWKQWSLSSNTGGIDIAKGWANYSGNGVKVGIIDDGFDYNHGDLQANYRADWDYDARDKDHDAFGLTDSDLHGTTVAGVLAAARNGSGIVGVAYDADVAGFRIGYGANGNVSQVTDALNSALSKGMDVINASWGFGTPYTDNFSHTGFDAAKGALQSAVANGRGGLGSEIVFAAGNNRAGGDNVNYHSYQNSPYVITVAGIDSSGHVTSSSTPGAALLVAAPGSSIFTDDRAGAAGIMAGDYLSASGTSYAAPIVSGVIALMLQANPNLGYRDVQEILGYSARNSDPTGTSWSPNGARDWNGGGLHFSHDYGFGLVDATAAVRLAESWQKQSTFANMSVQTVSLTGNIGIPDGAGSLQSRITLGSAERLDKVLVDLNITHARVSDLTVTLTSPHGTTAVLAAHPVNGTGTGIVFQTSANNFWGEDAKGVWTLTVTDSVGGTIGTLNGWTLQALGDAPNTPTVYIYTDEFATAAGAGRGVLHDTSGIAGINTAAVTGGSYLDLNPGAIDTIAGRVLQIGTDTLLKTAWAGDGNDIIIANNAGNMIEAGRGDDTIVAGGGGDRLWGGPGADAFVFNAIGQASDTIGDFVVGSDVIDLSKLFVALGYNGSDPLADHWLLLIANANGGTSFVIDPHNGQPLVTIVDVVGVSPTALQEGIDFWTTVNLA
jgi:subtilisin-like proprotein convertase family protein